MVAEGTFVYLRLRHLVTVVFGALFINRPTCLPRSPLTLAYPLQTLTVWHWVSLHGALLQ